MKVINVTSPARPARRYERAVGPVTVETETNTDGNYVFVALPVGSYIVDATYSGLEEVPMTAVGADQVVQVALQLRPPQLKTEVTVTASSADVKTPAPAETINAKTSRDAPNWNERFDASFRWFLT